MGTLFILSGPSGVGKNTVAERLLAEVGENLKKIVTTTTRKPRSGEKNGIDYNFISTEEFEKKVRNSEFLEYAKVHGDDYYGSPLADTLAVLSSGYDALLLIDTSGVEQILGRRNDFRIATIFLAPKNLEDLGQRIINRGTETEEEISKRLKTAENEIKKSQIYDHIVVSKSRDDDFAAVFEIYSHLTRKKHPP
ncbi:MAG: guanylate kinase [Puniceicoccales bacterium]|nr:guanylate kinase [Puniceicoccales bacterium]